MSQTATDPRAFRGKGLAFPLAVAPGGKLATANAEAKIEQSIWLLLSTALGERIMRPAYGCGAHDMLFAPSTPQNAARITALVRETLATQEPRIAVLGVAAEAEVSDPSAVLVRIDYRINSNNSSASMVYPFYITEGV
jgi:phage baseplate assembly protein W